MTRARYGWLVLIALCEIIRYELIVSLRGIGCILRQLRQQRVSHKLYSEKNCNGQFATRSFSRRVSTGNQCCACSDQFVQSDCSESTASRPGS